VKNDREGEKEVRFFNFLGRKREDRGVARRGKTVISLSHHITKKKVR